MNICGKSQLKNMNSNLFQPQNVVEPEYDPKLDYPQQPDPFGSPVKPVDDNEEYYGPVKKRFGFYLICFNIFMLTISLIQTIFFIYGIDLDYGLSVYGIHQIIILVSQ